METGLIDRDAVVILSPMDAKLVSSPLESAKFGAGAILVRTQYSVISAGTELAVYKGLESWAPLPFIPGYGSISRVLDVGSDVVGFEKGDMVFSYSSHATVNFVPEGVVVKTPASIECALVPVACRMGQVAMTSLRASSAEFGDTVVVQGLGLVGNLAAQLFSLAGCKVIGIDVSAKRIEAARRCGIEFLIDSSTEDVAKVLAEITDGEMAEVVVEATGIPTLVDNAIDFASQGGEVILLGSPRGDYHGNGQQILKKIHEASTNVRLKGAHEWSFPTTPVSGIKHSMERNVKQLIDLTASGKLHVNELISHIVKPHEVPNVYQQLIARNDDYFGVVIDWTSGL